MKRLIALFMALIMLLGLLCTPVFADKTAAEIIQQIKDTYAEAVRSQVRICV